MFPPYEVDISSYLHKGENEITLSVSNNLRNMQGPFHLKMGEWGRVIPANFYRESCVFAHAKGEGESCHDVLPHFDDRICLTDFGLEN
jgi:hypothetical protein